MLKMLKYLYSITFVFILTIQSGPTYAIHLGLEEKIYNGVYTGEALNYIAFPIGGMGAGMFCLDGTGSISHLSVQNHPDFHNTPYTYAAIHVKGVKHGTKVLEGQVPFWKVFGPTQSGMGQGDKTYGLPRFQHASFQARFPFSTIQLKDNEIPLAVKITGWSPFIPTDEDNSSLPLGVIEYQFTNTSTNILETTFSYNAKNFIDSKGKIKAAKGGFKLVPRNINEDHGMAIYVDDANAQVDYCWFRGDWFDAQSIAWDRVSSDHITTNMPIEGVSPGASIFVPMTLQPGETKTISLNFCWYFPNSNLTRGVATVTGEAFVIGPSQGSEPYQNEVTGFMGRQLLNSFRGGGDAVVGELVSDEFKINRRFLKFLVGGGNQPEKTSVNLIIDGKTVETAAGVNTEAMSERTWDLQAFQGKTAKIKIVDLSAYPWGHIMVDQFVLTDNKDEDLSSPSSQALVLEDFEKPTLEGWTFQKPNKPIEDSGITDGIYTYRPWYASKFNDLQAVIHYWNQHKEQLRTSTELFRDAFFDSTLPAEVLEAISSNLSILKSTTVLRQHDGRFWAWEGSEDEIGSCHGSCTHVWNYAQALPHLFPAMERTMRETEFLVNQNAEGHQNFRTNMPISRPSHDFHAAADGQLGGIMKVYRDWRISGNDEWLKSLYPAVQASLDYCIRTWDPHEKGSLTEPHHNTYDIEFWGADGMCTSFYTGALEAFVQMSEHLNKQAGKYKKLLKRSISCMDKELFNGEYYFQKTQWTGLKAKSPTEIPSFGSNYRHAEAQELLKTEGPKYQYGTGCLSDGIIGMWMASVCGLPEPLDQTHVKSHLNAVYKYNLRKNMYNHYNTQRPSYAMGGDGGLLLCTWPKSAKPTLPFVYSNEVWTGIEYQVASHLIMKGEVEKGLEIVRLCRNRYDGRRRNPFDEIECGHWYARAMSSYSILQALTGVRYDAVTKTMYINSQIGDFKSFISTDTGFGTIELKNNQPLLHVVYGQIDVKNYQIEHNNNH
ncbi:GH116 family glycosyl hydrolase [Hoylesella buccalis]|uniref:GH116 family glycosyl hydrolase n=1 Tax=Hoylesella buccalis TaxID=28127 RepID=UPI003995CA44